MFDRVPMLGQVPISEQAGFGGAPWSVSTPIPPPYSPWVTEAVTAPYLCPDGHERVLTRAQAERMGCVSESRGMPSLHGRGLAQKGGGGMPASSPGPAPSQNVAPQVQTLAPSERFFFPIFYPNYPQYAPPSRMVCHRSKAEETEEGEEVFVCRQEPAPPPAYSAYPTVRYPVRFFRWWM